MLKINDRIIELGKFPDGTLLMKENPNYSGKVTISWYFETNEELVALIFITKHLLTHGVNSIQLFMPYIPNARQDRVKNSEDIFTLKYFAETINSLGFNKIIVIDPHSSVSEALINNIEIKTPERFIEMAVGSIEHEYTNPYNPNLTLFYPDEGAMKRYSELIPCAEVSFGVKNRDWRTGKIQGLDVIGDIKNIKDRTILIVDDICSRGGTFYHSAKKLKELGAYKVFLYVTHCENSILSGEVLTSGLIEKVYTTDSLISTRHDMIEVFNI